MGERLRLVDWHPIKKGKVIGFALVEFPCGLRVHDVPVLQGRDGPWAALPTKPRLDAERRQQRDMEGRLTYVPVLSWTTQRLEKAFSARVVALVAAAHPEAFARGA
jgi:hypothetical protein